jgi:RNA polymerase sigma factor (sigma-70 family)
MAPLLSTPLLLRTQSDRRLAMLAADGHDRAFEVIVERYRRALQRYLRRLLSEALAEDVLQATFVRAWQALRAGTDVRDLRPWLYRIAHNQALNTLRAAGAALPAATEDFPAVSLEAHVERREELRETLHGIQALPERQRAALVAVAVADRPHADVAAELGMSDGALRQLLLRARTTLRAAASALTPYPLVTWLAGGQEVSAARLAEVAAGAGGAGVAVKAGAAMLAAGALVAGGPALRGEHDPARAKATAESAQADRPVAPRRAAALAAPRADHQAAALLVTPAQHRAPSGHRGSGHDGGDATAHGSGTTSGGSGGRGSSGSDGAASGHDGSSSSGPSASAGSEDSSGHGSSGSGSSGAGTSASGTSGSGTSGSGTSGSGTSGKDSFSGKGSSDRTEGDDGPAPIAATTQSGPAATPPTVPSSDDAITSGEGSGGQGSGDSGPGGGSGHEGPGG